MNASPTRRRFAVFASLGVLATLSACVVVPAGRHYGGGGAVVSVAPPAVQAEVIGVAPSPGWLWISGYWAWSGSRHTWVPGRWEAPRPGHEWVPHRWERDGRGWREHPGRWHRR